METTAIGMPRKFGDSTDPLRDKAHRVADQFETMFVQTMVQCMRKTAEIGTEGGGMFGSGPGADTYAGWFDNNVSAYVANNNSIGIREVLLQQMSRKGQITSDALATEAQPAAPTTASAVDRAAEAVRDIERHDHKAAAAAKGDHHELP